MEASFVNLREEIWMELCTPSGSRPPALKDDGWEQPQQSYPFARPIEPVEPVASPPVAIARRGARGRGTVRDEKMDERSTTAINESRGNLNR